MGINTYSILYGDDADIFELLPSSGLLAFLSLPDFENPEDNNTDNIYEVTLEVSDGNANSILNILIQVMDEVEIEDGNHSSPDGNYTSPDDGYHTPDANYTSAEDDYHTPFPGRRLSYTGLGLPYAGCSHLKTTIIRRRWISFPGRRLSYTGLGLPYAGC